MGHVRIPHDLETDPFAGTCPFHGDCLEGLASGPAMNARWLQPAEQLPADHPGWALEARYLALALVNFICTVSPERIVIGGGVMSSGRLFPLIREQALELLGNYVRAPQLLNGIDDYIVPPWLGEHAGVLGALALAQREMEPPGS
jgi:fructokinase